ncbi:hypothetical protein [Mycolicibacterium sp.]|uniref:hypothetical protein n=1 Tax=Mycolicibacterium sp. TaxID=2320850 RepID=UPI0037C79C2A
MSTSAKRSYLSGHRSRDLPVRRWLQLGAATAGIGAALIGWSLVGSGMGLASADSGVGSSSAGSAASSPKAGDSGSAAASRARSRSTPARTVNRTQAARDVKSRPSSRAAAPNSTPLTAKSAVAASRSDPFGALGKFFLSTVKELFNRKTTLNPIQRLDDLTPKHKSLFDLIPKIPVQKHDSLWYREAKAREAERQQQLDSNARQIQEIVQKGMKLTDRTGSAVYTIDGRTFVTYRRVFADRPPEPKLITVSSQISDRNQDIVIRNNLKLDPAQVRSLWRR